MSQSAATPANEPNLVAVPTPVATRDLELSREERFYGRRDLLAFAIATVVTFAGYFYTLQPSVGLEDSGEFLTAAHHLGVPHPPGYPIWTILAFIWQFLVPFGNIAWRINLMSAVFGSVAVGLAALIISKTGHLMGARVGFLRALDPALVNVFVLAASVSAALMLAFSPVMWSQAIITEVYALNAFFLLLTLVLLYRWSFEPERRWRLYLAAFIWGVSLTNHQTLVLLTIAFPLFVWLVDRKLGRDTLIPILAVVILAIVKMLFDPASMLRQGPFAGAVLLGFGVGAGVWLYWLLTRDNDNLMQRWPQVLALYGCVLAGLSLYGYMHLASCTNPPMNWGFCSTWQGFVHHFTRGQYEKVFLDRDLFKFWGQINMFFDDLQSQFNVVFALLALMALFFYRDLDRRDRDWLKFLLVAFLFLGLGFLFLSNPGFEKQKQFTDRVFFLPGHCIYALWIGYGLILGLGYMLTAERQARNLVPILGIAFVALRLGYAAVTREVLSADDILLVFIVAAVSVLYLVFPLVTRGVAVYVQSAILLLLPAVSFARNWANVEQRGHDFGYQFGYLMFKPGGGYPEMERNAVLYGGTDPGRFVPTYMIFVESQVPPRAKSRFAKYPESGTFDRSDVYIITQNALADSTYMSYIRDHYDYSRPRADDPNTLTNRTALYRLLYRWAWKRLGRDRAYPAEPIWIPSERDSQAAFAQYVEELKTRPALPEEQVRIEGGRVSVQGVQGVMAINGILTKMIFDHNKHKHAFYVEESYVIPWMYPYLEPFGIIMKINAEPLPGPDQNPDLWQQIIARDRAYWDALAADLESNPRFRRDDVAQKTFSKLRSAIGGLYAARATLPGASGINQQTFFEEAEYAFRQAVRLCPDSPEANFRLAQLYVQRGRFDEAEEVLTAYEKRDIYNTKIKDAINTIREIRNQNRTLSELEQRYAANPQDLQAGWDLLLAYARQGRFDAMDAVANSLIVRADFPEQQFLTLAQAYAQLKRLDRVTAILTYMTQRYPQNNMGWYNLAAVYAAQNDCASAAVALQRALMLDTPERVVLATARQDNRFAACRGQPDFERVLAEAAGQTGMVPLRPLQ